MYLLAKRLRLTEQVEGPEVCVLLKPLCDGNAACRLYGVALQSQSLRNCRRFLGTSSNSKGMKPCMRG
jgi:hypothetical protein